jgi:NAD(P)H-dependent flavin oxidoreductase YrpB (nitropropane dioxygenase family)
LVQLAADSRFAAAHEADQHDVFRRRLSFVHGSKLALADREGNPK